MNEMPVFERGDRVLITCAGFEVAAEVLLVSSNGAALALAYDAVIAGFAGSMPVMWDEAGATFRSIIGGVAIGLAKLGRPQ